MNLSEDEILEYINNALDNTTRCPPVAEDILCKIAVSALKTPVTSHKRHANMTETAVCANKRQCTEIFRFFNIVL